MRQLSILLACPCLWLGTAAADATCSVEITDEQVTLCRQDIERATIGGLIDAPTNVFRHGSETYLILPSILHTRRDVTVYHAITKEPLADPARPPIRDWSQSAVF